MGLRETGTGRNARRRSRRPPYRPPSEASAFYIIVEVCVVAGHTLQPCSRHPLEAVNGQRRHAHGRRNEEATRNLQALVAPQQAAGNSESERVGERDREYPPTTEPLPTEGHEPRHGGDYDQRPEVVGDVREIEAWAIRVTPLQGAPEILRLPLRDHPLRNQPAKVLPAHFISSPRPSLLVRLHCKLTV